MSSMPDGWPLCAMGCGREATMTMVVQPDDPRIQAVPLARWRATPLGRVLVDTCRECERELRTKEGTE